MLRFRSFPLIGVRFHPWKTNSGRFACWAWCLVTRVAPPGNSLEKQPPADNGNGMNGAKDSTNGDARAVGGSTLTGSRRKRIATAREQYAAGADTVRGVRPEILM